MSEEINNQEVAPSPEEVLVKMKETMVPKEEAESWQAKYNNLFASVANGSFQAEKESEVDQKALAESNLKGLYDGSISGAYNRAVALQQVDDYLVSIGKDGIFGKGETEEQKYNVNKFREFHKYAIENSQGDDSMFATIIGRGLTN